MILLLMAIENEEDRDKLEAIYSLYRNLLFYTAFNILKDYHEAENVVHSAIVKICEHIDKINDVKCNKTKGFLVIIVRNLAINVYNQRKRKQNVDMKNLENVLAAGDEVNPENLILKHELFEWIARKLALINPEYADVLVMRYTYGLSFGEIANLTNTSEGSIRVKLFRARKALHKIMEGEYREQANE